MPKFYMDTNQTATPPAYSPAAPSPGLFGTKIPSTVAFAIAVLLFFMPFVDIKCNNMSLQTVSGFELAKGFKTKDSGSSNSLFNDTKADETVTTPKSKSDNKPNMYAIIAMGLGVVGLLLSFTNAKAAIGAAMVTGIASAGALIGLMLDIKKSVKETMPAGGTGTTGDSDLKDGLDKFSQSMDNLKISVDFTPWFYVAIVAFLAAAFFCFKRMSSAKR
jgi:hypothetical protein